MIIGLVGMLLGAVDPLEGSLLVLPATALAALGAGIRKTRQRRLLYLALGLVAFGVGALWVLSAVGGIGGSTGRSYWWAALLAPYAVGWLMGLVGTVLGLVKHDAGR
jgi:hypothetical protein